MNQGEWRFVPTSKKTICYALGAIKGTGQGAIEALVRERKENGPFKSFFDFCARVDHQQANKRVVEGLDQGRRLRFAAAASLGPAGQRGPGL